MWNNKQFNLTSILGSMTLYSDFKRFVKWYVNYHPETTFVTDAYCDHLHHYKLPSLWWRYKNKCKKIIILNTYINPNLNKSKEKWKLSLGDKNYNPVHRWSYKIWLGLDSTFLFWSILLFTSSCCCVFL